MLLIKLSSLCLLHNLAEENEFSMAQHAPRTPSDFLVGQTPSCAPGLTLVKEREMFGTLVSTPGKCGCVLPGRRFWLAVGEGPLPSDMP